MRGKNEVSIATLIAIHILFYFVIGFVNVPFAPSGIVLAPILIWVSVYDFRHFQIPDTASLLLVLSGLAGVVWISPEQIGTRLGAAIGLGSTLWLIAVLFKRHRGYQGLGLGDVKLGFGIGAWIGLDGVTLVILAASLAGILTILLMCVVEKRDQGTLAASGIAFGPFLCLSTWVVWNVGAIG